MKLPTISRLSTLILLLLGVVATLIAAEEISSMERSIPGGYSIVKDLTDERVRTAAQFAVTKAAAASDDAVRYSFVPRDDNIATVVRGYRQVVAGMNYKLVIVLTNSELNSGNVARDDIVGAFAVTVYDRFGDLSVTKWGEEVSVETAIALVENLDEFGEQNGRGVN